MAMGRLRHRCIKCTALCPLLSQPCRPSNAPCLLCSRQPGGVFQQGAGAGVQGHLCAAVSGGPGIEVGGGPTGRQPLATGLRPQGLAVHCAPCSHASTNQPTSRAPIPGLSGCPSPSRAQSWRRRTRRHARRRWPALSASGLGGSLRRCVRRWRRRLSESTGGRVVGMG